MQPSDDSRGSRASDAFRFLRDRLRLGQFQHFDQRKIRSLVGLDLVGRLGPVMRGLHTGIVDEADHILIDESVTYADVAPRWM